jgi:ferrochelatase
MTTSANRGVLLMTYGSPASLERDDVGRYLAAVRGGREADADLVDEFTRRYRVIGGSPLIGITRDQATALEQKTGLPVAIGMRFSEPTIRQGVAALEKRSVTDVVGIVLSPQYSPMLMSGYGAALGDAVRDRPGVTARVADAWYGEPAFVAALAGRIRLGLARFPADDRSRVHVLLTAHSLPRRVAERDPGYLDQLRVTAESVAAAASLEDAQWTFCWQSAGHEPGEWMKPDFADLMPELRSSGRSAVLVAPVQFLADHLEILYDIDVGAREQADAQGVRFERIDSLNDDPGLIDALAAVATRTTRSGTVAARGAR